MARTSNSLSRIVSRVKTAVHGNPALYQLAYRMATVHPQGILQALMRRRYHSDFGGTWIDRSDFRPRLDAKLRNGTLTPETARDLETFEREGSVILPGVIAAEQVDRLVAEIAAERDADPGRLMVDDAAFGPRPYTPDAIQPASGTRIVDYHHVSRAARSALLDPRLHAFLEALFERPPILTQSLYFEYGSAQPVHQDTGYVVMNSPLRLAACWIALEDIEPGSGELVYYPRSHRFPDWRFNRRFKHFDRERDGLAQQDAWLHWIHDEAARRGLELQRFAARKGDVLIWHADLAHGGGEVTQPGRTRRSLVGHYCPVGVRPLYAYYLPDRRRVFVDPDGTRHMSSYYTGEA